MSKMNQRPVNQMRRQWRVFATDDPVRARSGHRSTQPLTDTKSGGSPVKLSAVACTVALCCACEASTIAEGLDESREPAAVRTEALWAGTSSPELWPSPDDLEVCYTILRLNFSNPPVHPDTDFDVVNSDVAGLAWLEHVESLVTGAYNHIPGSLIDLEDWNECDTDMPGDTLERIHLILDITSTTSGTTGYFPGAYTRACTSSNTIIHGEPCTAYGSPLDTVETVVQVARLAYDDWFNPENDTAVLHEFAHALGALHEFDRADIVGTCAGEPADGSAPLANGIQFTPYDPDSILNGTYCHWNPQLTAYDELGFSIMYPSVPVIFPEVAHRFMLDAGAVLAYPSSPISHRWIDMDVPAVVFDSVPSWRIENIFGSPNT